MHSYTLILYFILDRDERRIAEIEAYLKAVNMFRNFMDTSQDPVYSEVSLDNMPCVLLVETALNLLHG